ncbi:hypothetical protein AWH56_003860 [Anaerobacillus isosaccharinicus]|uniref:Uncharacterized protein n=1 Tax=Anaerobacillus isosaccharinicus TaxID=1532552 RepID=A0A1S2M2G2_9BACI|nr:hypothetical protein [Anaerobacillus isosaccharinicus]MBA5584837.1 hypothetical protein [Anaerobacillus isosaccharinicus]QOY36800.1 hypothetical protein AWH56_003860 [Anaerobacillus isosaccharinicus]
MNDILLLLRTLTRGEIIAIIQQFGIPVTGFTARLDRAPIKLLISSLKSELENGLLKRKRKRGKKFTEPQEVYEYLAYRYLQNDNEIVLEEIVEKVQVEEYYSRAAVLAILYLHFKELLEEKRSKIEDNIEQDEFILKGIVEELSLEEKMGRYQDKLLESERNEQDLKALELMIIEELGEEEYLEIKEKVNQGDETLYRMLRETRNFGDYVLFVPFLLENRRYTQKDYASLLVAVLLEYSKRTQSSKERNQKALEYADRELERLKMVLKEKNDKHSKLLQENDKLQTEYNELHHELQTYKRECENHQSFVEQATQQIVEINMLTNYIKQVLEKEQIIIVTNEIYFHNNLLFENRVIDLDTFNSEIKSKISRFLEGKVIFITRVSYQSTEKWIKHSSYLKAKGIPYCELSGYEIEEYLEQIFEFLYTRERYTL